MGSARACSIKLGDSLQLSYSAIYLLLLGVADEHTGTRGEEDCDLPT